MSASILFQNTKLWDGEITHPVDWHVHWDNYQHLELGDRVFLFRKFPRVLRRPGGIFAAGTVAKPMPGKNIIPPSTVVFEGKFMNGKITPHVNVQVDVPSHPVASVNPPECSSDYPILLWEKELPEGVPRKKNGTKIPPYVSVEDLLESLREAWRKSNAR